MEINWEMKEEKEKQQKASTKDLMMVKKINSQKETNFLLCTLNVLAKSHIFMTSPACGAWPSIKNSFFSGFVACAKNDVIPCDQRWAVMGETGNPSSANVIAGWRISFNDNYIQLKIKKNGDNGFYATILKVLIHCETCLAMAEFVVV